MEHKTIKKILIGLFFCVVLFVLSFLVEERSEEISPGQHNSSKQVVVNEATDEMR